MGRQEGRACGGRALTPFCPACVGECCCAPGGGGSLLFPSAPGKQCPRRVFYGSCWTLISFVPRLSRAAAAAALSPPHPPTPKPLLFPPPRKKRAPLPFSCSPSLKKKKKKKIHAPRAFLRPHRCPQQASPLSPTGPKCVANQFGINQRN